MASNRNDAAVRLRQAHTRTADDLAAILREHAEPLPELRHVEEFGARFDRFGAATVMLLGAATRGTAQFYDARAAITKRLIEQHGFSIVAVEETSAVKALPAGHSAGMPETYPFGL
jgi:erythromycin esterase-like protein